MRISIHFSLVFIAFAIISCVSCQSKQTDTHNAEVSEKEFDKIIVGDKLVMVDFYTTWCGPCKKMAPFVQQIKSNRIKDVVVLQVDAESQFGISDRYRLEGYPTLIFFKRGQVIGRALGYQNYDALSTLVDRFK
ncbi:MAG: thioredoxin [Flavobacteriaceae bacterium]|nr:thioredoxin [Flavobacteriaceae bacterium]